jgi:outer membrane lipoprotein SlyB
VDWKRQDWRSRLGPARKKKARSVGCAALIGTLALSACAVAPPTGPDVVALPGKGKSFEAFQADDVACKQYASAQIGGASPAEAANQSAVDSTVLGTAIGAIAGAAIGAATGNPAAGTAIGAGSGFFVGGATGLNAAQASSLSLQQRYDRGYIQCMSAKGENVQTASTAYPVYPYPAYYPYYYPYRYPYPYYGPAFGVGIGFGFHGHRFRDHHFHEHHFRDFHRFHR